MCVCMYMYLCMFELRCLSVGIRLEAGWPGFDTQQGQWHFVPSTLPVRLRDPFCLLYSGYRGVRWSGRETDHSSLSTVDVQNARSYIFTSPYVSIALCLITQGENFIRLCIYVYMYEGTRGSVVGWGTMLQAERSRFDSRWGYWIFFFNLPNPSSRTMSLWSTQPLTEMITRNLPGGK
jgi:hypothetical protein